MRRLRSVLAELRAVLNAAQASGRLELNKGRSCTARTLGRGPLADARVSALEDGPCGAALSPVERIARPPPANEPRLNCQGGID